MYPKMCALLTFSSTSNQFGEIWKGDFSTTNLRGYGELGPFDTPSMGSYELPNYTYNISLIVFEWFSWVKKASNDPDTMTNSAPEVTSSSSGKNKNLFLV